MIVLTRPFEGEDFMKEFIVLCSTIILGIAIYNMIMGQESDSVMSAVSEVWQQGVLARTSTP